MGLHQRRIEAHQGPWTVIEVNVGQPKGRLDRSDRHPNNRACPHPTNAGEAGWLHFTATGGTEECLAHRAGIGAALTPSAERPEGHRNSEVPIGTMPVMVRPWSHSLSRTERATLRRMISDVPSDTREMRVM